MSAAVAKKKPVARPEESRGNEKLRIGIIGAAGLSAGKLLELLVRHPHAEIVTCISESSPGAPVASAHPHLRSLVDQNFDAFDADKLAQCDVVFSCKRHGDTFEYVQQLLHGPARIIDLSGDFRLTSSADYVQWYNLEHKHPHLLADAVYGLPELHRDAVCGARLIANPGCYTTTSILGCAPLVAAGYGAGAPILIDAISGVSGAGRNAKAENQYLAVSENVRAYRVGTHQHTPEIEQQLAYAASPSTEYRKAPQSASKLSPKVLFVPKVGPFKVGIMATCYLQVAPDAAEPTRKSLHALLQDAYSDEPFVRVSAAGELPQIEHVAHTNFCDIGVEYDTRTRTIVVVSVLDNLIKGAAGQAIQNMNILFNLSETAGLL